MTRPAHGASYSCSPDPPSGHYGRPILQPAVGYPRVSGLVSPALRTMASQHDVDSSTRVHAARLAELTQQLTAIAQELAQLQDGSCPPPEPSVAARSISDGGLRKRAASTPARRARKGGDGGGDSGGDSKAEAGPTGKRRRRKTRGASVAKDHASDDEGAGAKGAESTGGESEYEVVRPDIYPHAPRHQLDSLESNKFEDLELLDALKLRTFEVGSRTSWGLQATVCPYRGSW